MRLTQKSRAREVPAQETATSPISNKNMWRLFKKGSQPMQIEMIVRELTTEKDMSMYGMINGEILHPEMLPEYYKIKLESYIDKKVTVNIFMCFANPPSYKLGQILKVTIDE
jgi:hypothetical protein